MFREIGEDINVTDSPGPRQGTFYRSGFFRQTLDESEQRLFDELYADVRIAYPDLDDFADDALLIELIKTQVKLQRQQPPAEHTSGDSKRNVYDYAMARSKLMVTLADALGLTRKQRKEQETGRDLEKALAKFFTQDGRSRDQSRGRTMKKESLAVAVEVDAAAAEREARFTPKADE